MKAGVVSEEVIGAREAIGGIVWGIILWGCFRFLHRFASKEDRTAGYRFITVPSWFSAVCGRPLPDNKLEISLMVGQIGGLVLSVLWLPMVLLGLDHELWVGIYSGLVLGIFLISVTTRAIVVIVSRLR